MAYHDEEWDDPLHDDQALFDKLCMRLIVGLSWETVLNKRSLSENLHGYHLHAEMDEELEAFNG